MKRLDEPVLVDWLIKKLDPMYVSQLWQCTLMHSHTAVTSGKARSLLQYVTRSRSEADPKVLAQYIIALLKNNAEEKMRDACLNQLDVFLQPGVQLPPFRAAEQAKQSFLAADSIRCHFCAADTSAFVGDLFAYLKESGMLTDEPAPPVQASGTKARSFFDNNSELRSAEYFLFSVAFEAALFHCGVDWTLTAST
jgi:hypothetical protein